MIVAAIQGRLQKFQKKHIAEVNDYEDQYPSDDDITVQIFYASYLKLLKGK